jgi:DNA-binding GntR family transcriptional regulator
VRAALEGLAVRQIIASPRREDAVRALRAALDQLSDEGEDFPARIEADLAFHLELCRQAGNSMLVEAWQHLEGRMRVAILNGATWQAPMMARDRHAPIVDAIENADVSAALAVVDEHMASAAERFTESPESV